MVNIVLLHPEIPQNTGAIARSVACFGGQLHLIEPLGFVFSPEKMRRAGMDYLDFTQIHRHISLESFLEKYPTRHILMTTKANGYLHEFQFQAGDNLFFGNESSGAPEAYHRQMHHRIKIQMAGTARSLNLAVSVAISLYEFNRQVM